MINDFDLLLQKCKARAYKRILRIALRGIGSIVLVITGIFAYLQWNASQTIAPLAKTPKKAVSAPLTEENSTLPSSLTPAVSVTSQPVENNPLPSAHALLPTPVKTVSPPIAPITPSPNNRILEVSNASNTPATTMEIYQRTPKFETALNVARDFYTKENYSEAAVWAKKANQMNREAEEAWLLYAKSYYAQGKKSEAIGVLELYLNYKDSKAAAELIKAWR